MDICIKNEFSTDYTSISFCHACLSTDRELSTATEYIDFYYKICDNPNMQLPVETYLCWECVTLLKRLKMFTRKVAKAQRLFQTYNTNQEFPQSLSNLTSYNISNNNEIQLVYEEKEMKPIKEEIHEFDDDFDNLDVSENIKDDPEDGASEHINNDFTETKVNTPVVLAKSNPKESMKQKNLINRKAKYRFLNMKLKKHRRLLIKKVPIKLNELLVGLEEEREGSFMKEKYKCVHCVAAWKDKDGLETHNKMCHDEGAGTYQCDICQIRCPSEENLLLHRRKHLFQRQCKVCRAQFYSRGTMERHLARHHRMVQCLSCELCFKNVPLFYTHYKAVHRDFVCDVCGKRCRSRDIIERHLKYHFGYECPHCKKRLKTPSSFKHHVESQHVTIISENLYCVLCDKTFANDRLYKQHLLNRVAHALEAGKPKIPLLRRKPKETQQPKRRKNVKYPCPECSNVYTRKTYMDNHYRHVHSKQSKYYCEECDRPFLNRTKYTDHVRYKHSGAERPKDKECGICGRGFAYKTTLENHVLTHTGARPHACAHCAARFTQRYAMLTHVKTQHMKNKPRPSL